MASCGKKFFSLSSILLTLLLLSWIFISRNNQWDRNVVLQQKERTVIVSGGEPNQIQLLHTIIDTNNRRKINLTVTNTELLNMSMPNIERALFLETVYDAQNYLEWGSGYTTMIVPLLINKQFTVYSIEHVQEWCDKLRGEASIQIALTLKYLTYSCVDTGYTEWNVYGRPKETYNVTHIVEKYVNEIDKFPLKQWDVVFIDGRFRMACALKLLIDNRIHSDSVVMVHDYLLNWPQRKHYPIMNKYFDRIQLVNSLAFFKRNQTKIDIVGIEMLLSDFKNMSTIVD